MGRFFSPYNTSKFKMEISNSVHIDARTESYNSRFNNGITGRASNLYQVVYQTCSNYSEIHNSLFSVPITLVNLK